METASKGKNHCSHFSHTNAHLPSFLIPVSNIWLTAMGRIAIHQRAEGERPLAALHRQGMVVASQPSSPRPLGTGLGLVLGGVRGSSISSSPPFALLLPRWGFGARQHGTALAQATCVSGPAGCPPRCRLFPLLNAATCGFVFFLEAFIITGGLQRSLRNGFISSRCHTINAKCYYQTQPIDTCRIGRGA